MNVQRIVQLYIQQKLKLNSKINLNIKIQQEQKHFLEH